MNMVKGITIRSKKQTSMLFYVHAVLVSSVKSVLILNIAYFFTFFVRKGSTYLHRAKKKVKSLKIENFNETSKADISEQRTIVTRPASVRFSEF